MQEPVVMVADLHRYLLLLLLFVWKEISEVRAPFIIWSTRICTIFFVKYFSWVKSNSSPHCILSNLAHLLRAALLRGGGEGEGAIHLPSSGKVPLGVGVQCITSNGHMGSPREQNDRQFVSSKRKIFRETFYKLCMPFTFKCPVLTAVQVEDPAVELYLQAQRTRLLGTTYRSNWIEAVMRLGWVVDAIGSAFETGMEPERL